MQNLELVATLIFIEQNISSRCLRHGLRLIKQERPVIQPQAPADGNLEIPIK